MIRTLTTAAARICVLDAVLFQSTFNPSPRLLQFARLVRRCHPPVVSFLEGR